jgi:hypothetical protein
MASNVPKTTHNGNRVVARSRSVDSGVGWSTLDCSASCRAVDDRGGWRDRGVESQQCGMLTLAWRSRLVLVKARPDDELGITAWRNCRVSPVDATWCTRRMDGIFEATAHATGCCSGIAARQELVAGVFAKLTDTFRGQLVRV